MTKLKLGDLVGEKGRSCYLIVLNPEKNKPSKFAAVALHHCSLGILHVDTGWDIEAGIKNKTYSILGNIFGEVNESP
jgi:hypothetical protein